MRRLIAVLLVALLCMGSAAGIAEDLVSFNDELIGEDAPQVVGDDAPAEATASPEPEEPKYDEFVIGATTKLSGMFFTNMWGNNTADIDVRTLIHAYSPVVWTQQTIFEMNPQVVNGMQVAEYEDGNKIYMISLQEDLVYNDGTPIGAADYLFSLMLHASPVIGELGGITTNSSHIEGYEAYVAGETDVFSGLRLVDELTFTVEIKADYLPFFYELGMLDVVPYPISVIAPGCEVVDEGEGAKIQNIDPQEPAPLFTAELLQETVMDPETGYLSHPARTSGPYTLTSFDWETREATFEINENFKGTYDGAVPTIDNLRFKSVIPETMIEEYTEGEVQLLNKVVAGENIDAGLALVNEQKASSLPYPRLGFGFLSFVCEEGPFASEAVRKAVAYSIDVPTYQTTYSEYAVTVYGYMGIGQWMYLIIEQDGAPPYVEDEEEVAKWEALNLEGLNTYEKNLDTAKALLEQDGWTLNADGNPYVDGTDTVRYKMVDGQLTGLTVRWAKMEDSVAAELLDETMAEDLAAIGMDLVVTVVPFTELLDQYYRHGDREYDMFYLASNFISIFDPYFVFNTDDAYQGTQNTTGFKDETLEALAKDLRETEPGALLEYMVKWIALQEYWNEKLPMLPLYSNIYFDFFVTDLTNYMPDAEMNWPTAIIYAYTTDAKPQWLVDKEAADLEALEAAGEGGEELVTLDD